MKGSVTPSTVQWSTVERETKKKILEKGNEFNYNIGADNPRRFDYIGGFEFYPIRNYRVGSRFFITIVKWSEREQSKRWKPKMEELHKALKDRDLTVSTVHGKGRSLVTTRDFYPGISLTSFTVYENWNTNAREWCKQR